MEEKIIDNKVFRYVVLRGRGKWIAEDGDARNKYHFNQKATKHTNCDGYPCFGGGVPVHLYVATAWVDGWFPGAEVDHIDLNRGNYAASNLRWVSHAENVKHSANTSNHYSESKRGSKNGRSTLSDEEVVTVRSLFADGYSTMEVIKLLHPDFGYQQRRSVWNRYNRIKTMDTWKQ